MFMRIAISVFLASHASIAPATPTDSPVQRGEQIGRYVGNIRAAQQVTYRLLDYCGEVNPAKRGDVVRAREEWDKRNLALVTSWREVVKNWLIADDVAAGDVASTIDELDVAASQTLEALKPAQDELIKRIAAKPPEERTKTCAILVGLVIGGGRDIRVTSPASMKIYEKFAPTSSNSAVGGVAH